MRYTSECILSVILIEPVTLLAHLQSIGIPCSETRNRPTDNTVVHDAIEDTMDREDG